LILLWSQRAWQPLRCARNVLATDQMGQIRELRIAGKLFEYAAPVNSRFWLHWKRT
jgi:hypothetical protein